MRSISALIAATFCALVLSGPAFAGGGKLDSLGSKPADWLEFRTAFAAEDLWQDKPHKIKSGRATSPVLETEDLHQPATIADTASAALQHGLSVLRQWGKAADRAVNGERSTFDVAGN
jgi:hypothetical protein